MVKKATKKIVVNDPVTVIQAAIMAAYPDATFVTINVRVNVPTPDGTTHYMVTFVSQQQHMMTEYLTDDATGNIVARI